MTVAVCRRFVWCISIIAMFAPKLADGKTEHVITILHTNDIHGHITAWAGWEGELAGKTIGGMDRLAAAINQVRHQRNGQVLLLDAGDAIGDTMIADETDGAAVLQVMNALGYDAMTIGNHEPDFGAAKLRKRIDQARFPVIAANIRRTADGELFTKPYLVREIDGVRVGILGLAYSNTPFTTAKKNVEDFQFLDAPKVAGELIPKMRDEGAQIIIALTHYGLGADLKLAENVPGIDLIVGGHSHNRVAHAIQVGRTLIVQAGAHCSDLGRVDLTIIDGQVVSHESKLILLDHAQIAADPKTAALISEIIAPFKTKLNEPIAEAKSPIVRAQTIAGAEPRKRDEQSPADSLFADILCEETKSDIGLLPGVGYGVAIQPGPITGEMLRNLIPHKGKVVTMKLTGAQIRDTLEQAIENTFTEDPAKKVGGMIQVSGLRFSYDRTRAMGQRVVDLSIDSERSYAVVTNSMLADGGHHYAVFRDGKDRQEHGGQFEIISAAMKKRGEVSAPFDERIKAMHQP